MEPAQTDLEKFDAMTLGNQSQSPDNLREFDNYSGRNAVDLRSVTRSPNAQVISPSEMREQKYISRNTEGDIPFDTHTGADALTRLTVGSHRNKMEKLDILRKMYGSDKIRLDTEGNFIVRMNGDDGKPRDLLVDERNLSARDLLDLTSEAPAFALSLLTTKGVPAKQIFQTALRGAGGYLAGGAATDVVARGAAGESLDIPEILSNRTSDAASQAIFGYGLGKGMAGIGTLSRMASAASSKLANAPARPAAMEAIQGGREAVQKRFGIEMEPTLGELTGAPFALRLESFLSNIPFVRSRILGKWQKQLDNERAVQSALYGGELPDPSKTGSELMDLLGGEISSAEQRTGKAASIARRQGVESVSKPLKAISGPEMSDSEFGSDLIKRGDAQLKAFKEKAAEKFNAVRSNPDALEPRFDTAPLKKEVADLRKNELVNRETGGESIRYDQYGNASSEPISGEAPIKQLIPSGVDPILSAVDELPDKMSYFDLVRLRQSIYDRVDSPEPISSRGTYLLKRLGSRVKDELESQGEKVLEPATRALVQDANQFYSKNVDTFYQKGISEMLKPRTESGAVNPELVASRLLAGGKGSVTTYNTFKQFFGASQPEVVQNMNRMLRDKILDSGTDAGTGLLKLEDLTSAVDKLEPEIARELFGVSKEKLLKPLRQIQLGLKVSGARAAEGGTQAAVEAQAFKSALEKGEVNSFALERLVKSGADLQRQYSNSIRRAVTENDLGVIEAAPETFAKNYLFNTSVPFSQVKDVMQSVYRNGNQDLIEDLRRTYLAEIFRNSAKAAKGEPEQLVARVQGSPLRDLDPQALSIQLENPAARQRMELILGHDRFEALREFALSIGGRAKRDMAGATTGAFTGGSLFERMLNGLSGLSELPKYAAMSYIVTNPKFATALRSGLSKVPELQTEKLVKAAVLIPEFFQVLSKDATSPQEAYRMANEIKNWAQK